MASYPESAQQSLSGHAALDRWATFVAAIWSSNAKLLRAAALRDWFDTVRLFPEHQQKVLSATTVDDPDVITAGCLSLQGYSEDLRVKASFCVYKSMHCQRASIEDIDESGLIAHIHKAELADDARIKIEFFTAEARDELLIEVRRFGGGALVCANILSHLACFFRDMQYCLGFTMLNAENVPDEPRTYACRSIPLEASLALQEADLRPLMDQLTYGYAQHAEALYILGSLAKADAASAQVILMTLRKRGVDFSTFFHREERSIAKSAANLARAAVTWGSAPTETKAVEMVATLQRVAVRTLGMDKMDAIVREDLAGVVCQTVKLYGGQGLFMTAEDVNSALASILLKSGTVREKTLLRKALVMLW